MNFKRYIPQFSAIVIFAVITAFFFSPLIFDGKKLEQGDVDHYLGASKEISDFRDKTGQEPLWTNSMFGGMPAYQISIKYPNDWVQYIQKFFIDVIPAPATIVFLCMVGFYFLLVTLSVGEWMSVAGAIGFGLSSYFIQIIVAGHNTKGFAIAYMAPVIMGVLLTMRGRLFLGAALTALALALEMYSNHLQITYYLMILVALIFIGEAIRLVREKKTQYLARATGMLGIAVIIAILPNVTNLVLTNEYGNYSTRGKSDITVDAGAQTKTSGLPIEYATQWSYGKGETFTLMVPDYNGGASEAIASYNPDALNDLDGNMQQTVGNRFAAYFGNQPFTSGPVYVGAVLCFLAILSLFIVKDKLKWWLLAATLLSIMLAWGKNFLGLTEFFFNHVPGYNKFRAVSMTLVIAELTIPLMAMLAIREIVNNTAEVKEKLKFFYISLAITGGLCALIYLNGPFSTNLSNDQDVQNMTSIIQKNGGTKTEVDLGISNLESARMAIVKADAARSLLFILLAAGVLWFYIRKPFNKMLLAGAFSVLFLLDMWGVSHRYIHDENYSEVKEKAAVVPMTVADQMILKDVDPDYRVLNLAADVWQDANTSYYHKSIGGYHGAKLKRIQELYENVMEKQIGRITSSFSTAKSDSAVQAIINSQSTVNMLNAKYLIYNPEKGGVIPNTAACGSVWFVGNIKWVATSDEELNAIDTLDPKKEAVIVNDFKTDLAGLTPKADSTASIKLTSYAPNDLKYESNATSDQLAVFSEIYYNGGWNAYVDGKLTPHVRANFVLRAMKVPSGKHNIEFKFEPSFYFTGEKISIVGSLLLICFIGGAVYLEVKKKKTEVAEKE